MPRVPMREYNDVNVTFPDQEWIEVEILKADYRKSKFADKDGNEKYEVNVCFEPVNPEFEKQWLWKSFGFSLHPKGFLRPLIQAAHPDDLSDDQLAEFDTDDLVGKHLLVMGKYVEPEGGGEARFRPTAYKRLAGKTAVKAPAKAAAKPQPVAAGAAADSDLDF